MSLTPPSENDKRSDFSKVIRYLQITIVAIILLILLGFFTLYNLPFQSQSQKTSLQKEVLETPSTHIASANSNNEIAGYFNATNFDTTQITNKVSASFISYGKKLISQTAQYLGPEAKDPTHRFAGNNLSCNNCHLSGGTRPYAAPYVGVWGIYPSFRGRSNTIGTLEDRINGCMERSMNGKSLPLESREMKAIMSYIKFVSKDVPIGERINGQGFATLKPPARAADMQHGKTVFEQYCTSCHGKNGEGIRRGSIGDGQGYLYPPLCGPDSFNDGAGMHRILTAARFIKANMPYGVPVGESILSDEQAYDVAAYINSFPRPVKAHKEKDYPDLKKKPIDCPYPPYADTLSLAHHRYGPFVMD